jgi:hypothetical protein
MLHAISLSVALLEAPLGYARALLPNLLRKYNNTGCCYAECYYTECRGALVSMLGLQG